MPYALETLDVSGSLGDHQGLLRRHEAQGYRLLSLAAGLMEGRRANIVTFAQDPAAAEGPGTPLILEVIEAGLPRDGQQERLHVPAREIVCYGTLYVGGRAQNVVAHR
jgi:hypothetical protein